MADVCVPWGSGVPTPLQQLHLEQAGRAWGGWLLRELGEVAPQAKGHGQRPLSRVQFPEHTRDERRELTPASGPLTSLPPQGNKKQF